MPPKYKRCVRKVMKKVKPRLGRTKEQSAHAICTSVDAGGVKAYRARKKKRKGKHG